MTTTAPAPHRSRLPAPLGRFADFLGRHARGITITNIVAQGAIVVTGGVVRLSESGLGCSTAPKCEPDRLVPDLSNLSAHTAIEFSNRLMAPVLMVVAVAVAIAVWRTRPELTRWALVPGFGVLAQAVLGAFTVRLDLTPLLVAAHFAVSAVLIWQAVWLALTYRKAPRRAGRCIRTPLRVNAFLLGTLLVLGTLTTASGPHSGDAEVTKRLGLPLESITRTHSLTVWAFVLSLAYIVWRVRNDRSEGPKDEVRKAWRVLLVITVAQGAIGYVQYFTDLPEVLVGFHLAGAAALTAAHAAAYYLLRRKRPMKEVD